MPKKPLPPPTPPDCRDTLGLSPSALAKREYHKAAIWFPTPPYPEYDRYSDPCHPKTIYHSDVIKAEETLKHYIATTPLLKSKNCQKFDMSLYFKLETRHKTGSFHERSALYTLLKLTTQQRKGGVFTASLGNWAMALAHQGHLMKIHVTVVLPEYTCFGIVSQCQNFGAKVVIHGKDIDEAKTHAFKILADEGRVGTYLNGCDHPNAIAGAGCVGLEIFNQLPETDAILVPVGSGGLLAGIATVAKHIKPDVLIYGIEAGKNCCFAKALDNERPYTTAAEQSLAASLTVPKAGVNAFHTARSLIDKLVLVHDDWTARAILHLVEEESLLAEGAGAISLGALMCIPNILTELRGKKVVCIVSGGNMELWHLKRAIIQGKAAEGRIFTMTGSMCMGVCNITKMALIFYFLVRFTHNIVISALPEDMVPGALYFKIRVAPGRDDIRNKILRLMKLLQCNIVCTEAEREWIDEDKLLDNFFSIVCETKNFKQTSTLKHLVERFFPNTCEFTGDTFKPRSRCVCFPRILY